MDMSFIPPPVNQPKERNVLSLDDYRKERLKRGKTQFTMYLTGTLDFDDLDALIEDLDDNGLTVEGVFIPGDDDDDLPDAANDQ